LADLVVVGRGGGGAVGGAPIFSAVLFETGRPVLVAGSGMGEAGPSGRSVSPRRVVVAWKESAEAARAVSAALPLLARAERVTAVSARDDDERTRGLDALATYLSWHGIAADRRLLAAYPSVGEALAAAAVEADLVVMGGYSHSRLRELILGGVTRHMLEKTKLPLLLAH
jgi:nucleotide-binding universal stress UspA family protein